MCSTRPHCGGGENGILRPDQVPTPRPLPNDPATRAERYARLAKYLEDLEREPLPADEPEWTVEELFPSGRLHRDELESMRR